MLVIQLPGLGDADLTGGAIQQTGGQPRLQRRHLAADLRHRHAQLARCGSKAVLLGHGDELNHAFPGLDCFHRVIMSFRKRGLSRAGQRLQYWHAARRYARARPFDCLAQDTAMTMIKTRAAVAWAPNQPLTIEEVDLMPPQRRGAGAHRRQRRMPHRRPPCPARIEGVFPCILGHEGAGVVEAIGEGVTSVAVGDHVIPLYTPECGECKFCKSSKTNLCQAIRATQGRA